MCWHGGGTPFKHDSRWREPHVVGQTVTIAPGSAASRDWTPALALTITVSNVVRSGSQPSCAAAIGAGHACCGSRRSRAPSRQLPERTAHTEIVGTERGGRLCRQQGNAVAPQQSGRRPSRLPQQSERPVRHRGRYTNPALDQFSPCSGTKNDRRHGQRRCRSSALSWSHGMLCSRS